MNFTKTRDAGTELAAAGKLIVAMAAKMTSGEHHIDTQAAAARYFRMHIRQAREAIDKIESALREETES